MQSAMNQIQFSQGDTPTIQLVARNPDGTPIDITTASFVTTIRGANASPNVAIDSSAHTVVDGVNGIYSFVMTALQTQACGLGPFKDIITTMQIGSVVITVAYFGVLQVNSVLPQQ